MNTSNETISTNDFTRLQRLIYAESGIRLNGDKKTMLELRLGRRVRSLQLGSCAAYCDYLFSAEGREQEMVHFLDVVTTNKTDFFREPEHFRFLEQRALPEFCARHGLARPMTVWSAGCSSGEEPYTLAIVLSEFAVRTPGFRFRILATDLSATVLEKAQRAIYAEEAIRPVSAELRRKYFLRSRDRASSQVRVAPELRRLVEFRRLNFKDHDYGLREKVDAFFCRNVIIYFDRATQEEILGRISSYLLPGGYAFMGHSETLHGMQLPLEPMAPALYRRVDV